jgi:hypothetical protein
MIATREGSLHGEKYDIYDGWDAKFYHDFDGLGTDRLEFAGVHPPLLHTYFVAQNKQVFRTSPAIAFIPGPKFCVVERTLVPDFEAERILRVHSALLEVLSRN